MASAPRARQAEANIEYDAAMEELEALLAAGRSLDELQRVAKGEPPYANFKLQVSSPGVGAARARDALASSRLLRPRKPSGSLIRGG